jgi:hypothetical protein
MLQIHLKYSFSYLLGRYFRFLKIYNCNLRKQYSKQSVQREFNENNATEIRKQPEIRQTHGEYNNIQKINREFN